VEFAATKEGRKEKNLLGSRLDEEHLLQTLPSNNNDNREIEHGMIA
jgi:hypothetical protein